MCHSNPQAEKLTVWGFTEEEINHRWKVHTEFDPINRLFGSKEDKANKPIAQKKNSEAMMASLESLLTQG